LKGGKQLPGDSFTDPASGLPIGPLVNASPARRPERIVLRGRLVTIAPLDPTKHAESLFSGTHGPDKENIWLYLGDGPFTDRGAFRAYLEKRAKSDDPLSFAIVQNASGKALGHAAYMRITPEHRVIEVGNIFYTPAIARSTGATEAMYLKGRSRDTAWYAMVNDEWPQRRARLERWLAPENFDESGRQRLPLSSPMH
jgi:RimJ/RimL family protein N-acetyltransferase